MVIEAAQGSGTLITARLALEAGRELYDDARSLLDHADRVEVRVRTRAGSATLTVGSLLYLGMIPVSAYRYFAQERKTTTAVNLAACVAALGRRVVRERLLEARKPSTSLKSLYGPSSGRKPYARHAATMRACAGVAGV